MPVSSPKMDFDRVLAILGAAVAIVMPGLTAAGWLLHNETLKTLWPNGSPLHPITAVGLALGAASLILATFVPRARNAQATLGGLVLALGFVLLFQKAFGVDFGKDNVVRSFDHASVATSISLVAVGLALALFKARSNPLSAVRVASAVGVIVLAMTGIVDYVISPIDAPTRQTLTDFAFPSALAFLFLGFGVLAPLHSSENVSEYASVAAPMLGLAAMAALIIVTLSAVDAQHRDLERARSAEIAVNSLGHLLDLLRDAEIGQRGYLLTGTEEYLQPYIDAAPQAAPEIARMAALIENDAEGRDRLNRIRSLAEEKLAELTRTIDQKRAGDTAAAMAAVRSGEGKRLMDRLRREIAAMQAAWLWKSDASLGHAGRTLKRLQYTTVLAVSLVIGMAGFLLADGRRRFLAMRKTQQLLVSANQDLDRRVAEKTDALASALEGVSHSLTEIKAAKAELAGREAHLSSILDTVPDAMIVIDERGMVTSFSAAAAALFGYAPDEVVGRNVKMLMPEPYRAEHDAYIANYLRTGEAHTIGYGRTRASGHEGGNRLPDRASRRRSTRERPQNLHRLRARSHEPTEDGGGASAVAEDGGGRTAHGRYRPRFQ